MARFLFTVVLAGMVLTSSVWAEEGKQSRVVRAANIAATPVKGVVTSVANIGSGAKELVEQTVEGTKSAPPIIGTVEGINKGAEAVVDKTVKSAYKVGTLGFGELENYEREAPARPADYDSVNPSKSGKPATFKIKIPGT